MRQSQVIPSLVALDRLGAALASAVHDPLRIYLRGEIGAGKTTLVGAVLRAWGYHGIVKSPTFTFLETYVLPERTIFHIDLYRLEKPGELEYLGIRDYLEGQGVCFVEWPERGAGELPTEDIDLSIQADDHVRLIEIVSVSDRGEAALERLGRLMNEGGP